MELEELKTAWEELSRKVEKQDIISKQMIEKITRQQYQSRLNSIAYPEKIATVICYVYAFLLVVNFSRLQDQLTQICGVVSIAYLLIVPMLTLSAIRGLKKVPVTMMTYSEAIQLYARKKIGFQKLQKWNVFFAYLFMFVTVPVTLALLGKTHVNIPRLWMLIIGPGTVVYLLFSYWVLKSFDAVLKGAEAMISQLEE